jgi:hypothetical protein
MSFLSVSSSYKVRVQRNPLPLSTEYIANAALQRILPSGLRRKLAGGGVVSMVTDGLKGFLSSVLCTPSDMAASWLCVSVFISISVRFLLWYFLCGMDVLAAYMMCFVL